MKITALLALLGVAFVSQEQQRRSPAMAPEPMHATIRSADSTKTPLIRITIEGNVFKSMGVASRPGQLTLQGSEGNGTGVLTAELSTEPGEISFSVPVLGPEIEVHAWPSSGAPYPRLSAKGHRVTLVRDESGVIAVRTGF